VGRKTIPAGLVSQKAAKHAEQIDSLAGADTGEEEDDQEESGQRDDEQDDEQGDEQDDYVLQEGDYEIPDEGGEAEEIIHATPSQLQTSQAYTSQALSETLDMSEHRASQAPDSQEEASQIAPPQSQDQYANDPLFLPLGSTQESRSSRRIESDDVSGPAVITPDS
jgi:hypothetical protein